MMMPKWLGRYRWHELSWKWKVGLALAGIAFWAVDLLALAIGIRLLRVFGWI